MLTSKSTPASGRRTRTVSRRGTGERGTAIVGTFIGATIFLVLLLFSVQFLVRLYATSVLTSAAFDAAQEVATSPGNQSDEIAAAEASARLRLGSFGAAHTTFTWEEVDAQRVVLRVQAESPGFVPLPSSYRRIVRTVTVRSEHFR